MNSDEKYSTVLLWLLVARGDVPRVVSDYCEGQDVLAFASDWPGLHGGSTWNPPKEPAQ